MTTNDDIPKTTISFIVAIWSLIKKKPDFFWDPDIFKEMKKRTEYWSQIFSKEFNYFNFYFHIASKAA